jgi:hypothetical protein
VSISDSHIILVRRALSGQQPETPAQIMAWLEAVAQSWNVVPFLFGVANVPYTVNAKANVIIH